MESLNNLESNSLKEFLDVAEAWYESNRLNNGGMETNTMNSGLIVARMVADGLPVTEERLRSKGKSQVRGLSGSAIAKILADHGELRPFTREGGRTSRKTLPKAQALVRELNGIQIVDASPLDISFALEEFFTKKVQEDFFDKKALQVTIEPDKPVSHIVADILDAAAERTDRPTGVVLQHLVGAKLELRFPDAKVGRDRANAADLQTQREGDFQIGNTAFHVTVAPMEKLIERCSENFRQGYRPVLLVPESRVAAARSMAEIAGVSERINVVAAEGFIGTNVEEISVYDSEQIRRGIVALIRRYNERIVEVEVDKSLRIEEPRWMQEIGV